MILMTANSKFRSGKLKDAVLLLLFTAGLLTSKVATAQTKTIIFESGSWEEIKAKAAKESKLIFLDAYASWCRVCKKMEKNVFTNDSVADYFNTHFINAKLEMETREGLDVSKQYHVNVYPTFLFVDGQGKVIHRAFGGHTTQEFIQLGNDAQNLEEQNSGREIKQEAGEDNGTQNNLNNTEIGFNISQYQKDFGIGLHVISPYFLYKTIALKAGANIQWFEHFNGSEIAWSLYQNIQLGMRGRAAPVAQNIAIYGEGGIFLILPNSDFSSQSSVFGGYGLFGFEFRVLPRLAYFIELGGVGTGATADKIAGQPIYSNGFLINVGLNIGL